MDMRKYKPCSTAKPRIYILSFRLTREERDLVYQKAEEFGVKPRDLIIVALKHIQIKVDCKI